MHEYWSWTLAAIGITGIWLAGRNNKAGWAIGAAAQLLWLAYALATKQYGFIATAVAYGTMYGRNWWKWRQREQLESQEAADVPS